MVKSPPTGRLGFVPGQKMSDTDKKIDKLIELTEHLVVENGEIKKRLTDLESVVRPSEKPVETPGQRDADNDNVVEKPRESTEAQAAAQPEAAAQPSTSFDRDSQTLQQEFTVIRDAVQRVKLPNDLKLDDSGQGVAQKDRARRNVVQRCAKYSEATLKLLSTLQLDTISDGDIQDLITIAVAQQRYLQEEHAMILVNNNFGERVEKTYRNFRRNTSVFTSDAIEALQAAVTINNQADNQQRGGGGRRDGRSDNYSRRQGFNNRGPSWQSQRYNTSHFGGGGGGGGATVPNLGNRIQNRHQDSLPDHRE